MTTPRRIAVLSARSPSGEAGGAERFYSGLVDALNRTPGIQAEDVGVVFDERTLDAVQEGYLRFYDLALGDYDGVISTKAPSYVVRHPRHVCYLMHTMRVYYDMFDAENPAPSREKREERAFFQRLDSAALSYPRTLRVFAIGHEVRKRLLRYNRVDSEVLYPALTLEGLRAGDRDKQQTDKVAYAFLPGRLHAWKRVDLLVRAMAYVQRPLELRIAGQGPQEAALRALAQGDRRIHFHGRVGDEELIGLYANALVVPFVPLQEDYGLVTLEAFKSHKPVITCRDSGEPAVIVKHGLNGFVCEPTPAEIGRHLEQLFDSPALAQRMGDAGAAWVEQIRWEHVIPPLLAALGLQVSDHG